MGSPGIFLAGLLMRQTNYVTDCDIKVNMIVIRHFSAFHNQIQLWKCIIKLIRVYHVTVLITLSLPYSLVYALPKTDIS